MTECNHRWKANSGRGGQPEFRINRHLSPTPVMHVKCEHCNARTWMSETDWKTMVRLALD